MTRIRRSAAWCRSELASAVIVLVAAVARNGVIGAAGALPWSLPADLRRFRALTVGKPIVMGRATFDSIGRPLDERTNIVVTRNPNFAEPVVHRADGVTSALEIARREHGADAEVCVIGGGQIYELFMPMADRMELTLVETSPRGDASFPEWDRGDWQQTWSEKHPGPPPFEFASFVRTQSREALPERNPEH